MNVPCVVIYIKNDKNCETIAQLNFLGGKTGEHDK
jgi:hypothetical protein